MDIAPQLPSLPPELPQPEIPQKSNNKIIVGALVLVGVIIVGYNVWGYFNKKAKNSNLPIIAEQNAPNKKVERSVGKNYMPEDLRKRLENEQIIVPVQSSKFDENKCKSGCDQFIQSGKADDGSGSVYKLCIEGCSAGPVDQANKVEDCDKAMSVSKLDGDSCLYTLARKLGDATICDAGKAKDPNFMYAICIIEVAEIKNDATLCKKIPVKGGLMGSAGGCFASMVKKIKDPALCKEIDPSDWIFTNECYKNVAFALKDASLCEGMVVSKYENQEQVDKKVQACKTGVSRL